MPLARWPGTAIRTASPSLIRTSDALLAMPTQTEPSATVSARAPLSGMRRSTVEVSGRIRLTTLPSPATAQTAPGVATIASGQIPPRSSWIVATVRPVSGETRETVESSWFATQTEPWPIAIPVGRPPTGIRSVIRFVSGSMRSRRSAKMSTAQIEPKPVARDDSARSDSGDDPVRDGIDAGDPVDAQRTQSEPAAMTMLDGEPPSSIVVDDA